MAWGGGGGGGAARTSCLTAMKKTKVAHCKGNCNEYAGTHFEHIMQDDFSTPSFLPAFRIKPPLKQSVTD